ncbi:MAG: FapA family protein [bacterium]|nr:FapA family protein [bacterium]
MEQDLTYQFGTQDWEEELLGDEVIPGQLLAVKHPPSVGQPGFTVTGQKLAPTRGEDIPVIPGKNTYTAEDGMRIYSAAHGKIRWKGHRLDVEQELEITGDVDEDIDFDGRVKIGGSVGEKLKVQAAGDISIAGLVTDAEIISGGSVEIGQEVKKSNITAAEDIKAPAVKESILEAKGNILLEGELLGSTVSGYRVICSGRKGIILGGTVSAKKEISAASIGSEKSSVATEIKVVQGGRLSISGNLYPKVKMMLGRRSMISKKPAKKITFKIELSGVTTIPYEPPHLEPAPVEAIISDKMSLKKDFPHSIILSASSVEEGKRRGAELLNLPHTETSYKLIPKSSSRGIILRVFKTNVIGPWSERWDELYGPAVDGSFSFDNRADGLYVTIIHHRGEGKKVTPQDILKKCEENEFINIEKEKAEEACTKRIKEPMKIGSRQYIKGTVEVAVDKDESTASVSIIPPKLGGMMMKLDDVMVALKEKGVVLTFVRKERIIEALNKAEFNMPIDVAGHILPTPGKSAYLNYQLGIKDGREIIDSYAIPGQLLAVKMPAGYGNPGTTVLGNKIPAQHGEDFEFTLGKNTFLSNNSLKLFASSFGRVIWTDKQADVEQVFDIEGDINENIEFDGIVNVTGSLGNKFKINAAGDVNLDGGINDGEINSGGNVDIKQDIIIGTITALGHITAKSAKNSNIETKGCLVVEEGITNCTVKAERVIAKGKRGFIVGGTIQAQKEINAMSIGTEKVSVQTTISVAQGGKISSYGAIFPKVSLMLGRRNMPVKRTLKRLTLNANLSGITTSDYEEPKIDLTKRPPVIQQESKDLKESEKPKFPPSVVVYASSLEEGKRKGAELLSMFAAELEDEMLPNKEQPLLRIFPKGVFGPWKKEWEEMYGPPRDGSFELENKPDGLYLLLTPHRGAGKRIKPEDVLAEISKSGFMGVDSSKVIEACNSKVKTTVKIGIMQFTKDVGGKIKIDISDDGLKAFFTIIPPEHGELMLKPETVSMALKEKGVIVGIKEDAILNAFKNKVYEKPILVAEAVMPQEGKKAQFIYKIGGGK